MSFRASLAQEALWLHEQLLHGSVPPYHELFLFALDGALDVDRLRDALARVLARHEAWRTRLPIVDGVPRQVIDPPEPPALPVVELPDDDAVERFAVAESHAPMDLARDRLARFTLCRLAPQRHVLVLVIHHAIVDGRSVGLFLDELDAAYAGRALEPLAAQARDAARVDRERLLADEPRRLAFWRELLREPAARGGVPLDRPRPATPSLRGDRRPLAILAPTLTAVRQLAAQEGVTPFLVVMAAVQATLARLAQEPRVDVGLLVDTRSERAWEPLLGLFVDTLVLRGDLSGAPSFRALVGRVRDAWLAADEHRVPISRLLAALRPERGTSGHPLIDVLVGWQSAGSMRATVGDLAVHVRLPSRGVARFDLSLSFVEEPDHVRGFVDYAADLFDAATVDRFLHAFGALLAAGTADPDRAVARLPLLDDAERERVIYAWNDTAVDVPRDRCLHELFEDVVDRQPDAIAIADDRRRLTYRALDARANAVAAVLASRGVRPEVPVGVVTARSIEHTIALLAILKAGGAFVPLDPSHPPARLAELARGLGLGLVLAGGGVRAPGLPAELLTVEALDGAAERPRIPVRATQLAYVLHTSGSTGAPKAIAIEHRSVINTLTDVSRRFALGPGDRLFALCALAFDMSVYEQLGTLLAGATLLVPDEETVREPRALAARVSAGAITVWHSVPALLEAVLDVAEAPFPGVRLALCGGDVMAPSLPERLRRLAPGARFANVGGPTEVSIYSTCYEVPDRPGAPILYGRPLGNQRAYVLDGRGAPLPVAVPGELYLAGAGLARGYLGQPERTRERFVPDPFHPGERMYRTGDRVRLRSDGNLELLGRVDHQVKVRGFRVELGEIEAALRQQPGVAEAVVVVHDPSGARRLVAYLVPRSAPLSSELRALLAERLPDYMLPAAFVALDALPLNANGKVDRAALAARPLPSTARPDAPAGETEQLVASLWEAVLGRTGIGADEDFFALGGDSLSAARLAARVRAAFDVELPVRRVFELPTVAQLARALAGLERGGAASGRLRPRADRATWPLSLNQERALASFRAGEAEWVTATWQLDGALDLDALARAIADVAARHEVLRARFSVEDGGLVQRLAPTPPPLETHDLRALADAERGARAVALGLARAAQPLHPDGAPLVLQLFRVDEARHLLFALASHAVWDGLSSGLFLRELSAAYGAARAGQPSPFAAPELRYADFAAWQRAWVAGPDGAAQLAWWQERLAGARPASLPTDFAVEEVVARRRAEPGATFPRGSERWTAPPQKRDALAAAARRASATVSQVLLAAFIELVRRRSGAEDVTLPVLNANRPLEGTGELLGPFAQALLVRVDASGAAGVAPLVPRVRSAMLKSLAHADVLPPFLGAAPVRINFNHLPATEVTAGELVARPWAELDAEVTRFYDLVLAVSTGSALTATLRYNRALWTPSTARGLLDDYAALLASAL